MRVVLVDSCPVFREGLKSVMNGMQDLRVVGEAGAFRDVLEKIQNECDLLIVDGDLEALDLLRSLDKTSRRGRPPFVLVLSGHTDDHHAIQMLAAGADGYLCKSTPLEPMLNAIRKVARGRRYVTTDVAERILIHIERVNNPRRLSGREYEVLYLLASGLAVSEIAERLSLSVKTISTYRSRLLDKLHLRNNGELMRYAYKEGIMN
jgi:two-component system invasion response regulator UvrY